MQRMSVGLLKKPTKPLNAKQGVRVTGTNIIEAADLFAANREEVSFAAAA